MSMINSGVEQTNERRIVRGWLGALDEIFSPLTLLTSRHGDELVVDRTRATYLGKYIEKFN